MAHIALVIIQNPRGPLIHTQAQIGTSKNGAVDISGQSGCLSCSYIRPSAFFADFLLLRPVQLKFSDRFTMQVTGSPLHVLFAAIKWPLLTARRVKIFKSWSTYFDKSMV